LKAEESLIARLNEYVVFPLGPGNHDPAATEPALMLRHTVKRSIEKVRCYAAVIVEKQDVARGHA
jgi:hypothetical protein